MEEKASRHRQEVLAREESALAALRASEARFAAAFAASPIPMAITTLADGRYVEVNEAFECQIGYSRLEVHGRTSLELGVWPTPGARMNMVTALAEQKAIRSWKVSFRTKSGAWEGTGGSMSKRLEAFSGTRTSCR